MLVLCIVVVILLAALLLWYAVSRKHQKKSVPSKQAAMNFLKQYVSDMGIRTDLNALENVYIDGKGSRLHLAVMEAVGGKAVGTIVFIPGTSAYATWYIEFYEAMRERGFHIVGFDPRGHGESGGARGDYSILEIVEDAFSAVAYARERFGGKLAVVGSSQGGISAFYAAAEDDSLAAVVCDGFADMNGRENLVLANPSPPRALVPFLMAVTRPFQHFSIPIKLYLRLNHDWMKNGEDLETYYAKDPLWADWISIRALRSLVYSKIAKPVEKITVPVMLLHADKDDIFPQNYVEGIYGRLNCPKNYLLMHDTDHLVLVNSIPELAPEIDAWLKEMMNGGVKDE